MYLKTFIYINVKILFTMKTDCSKGCAFLYMYTQCICSKFTVLYHNNVIY